ncbi:MAG: hypothetical protein K2U26_12650 [Cyclobacteriaceae bacterium]|nr:hypothetical protein [Cyclobacteriaceae bacterium]
MKTLIIILSVLSFSVAAQVGFNNPAPDPSSILDLTANDKGLLIPRINTIARNSISAPAEGLLVYDTDARGFYFYASGWYSVNGWVKAAGNNNVSLSGNATVNGNTNVTGTISASNYALNNTGNGSVPVGGIIMWSGSPFAVPTGWALCDGNNGTPNLLDRFIVGAGGSYALGNTGGANAITLTDAQSGLPNHNHGISDPGHVHGTPGATTVGGTGLGYTGGSITFPLATTESATTGVSVNFSGAQNATQPHENRPPYYALAYIMKL